MPRSRNKLPSHFVQKLLQLDKLLHSLQFDKINQWHGAAGVGKATITWLVEQGWARRTFNPSIASRYWSNYWKYGICRLYRIARVRPFSSDIRYMHSTPRFWPLTIIHHEIILQDVLCWVWSKEGVSYIVSYINCAMNRIVKIIIRMFMMFTDLYEVGQLIQTKMRYMRTLDIFDSDITGVYWSAVQKMCSYTSQY